jgi:hypothetical protein
VWKGETSSRLEGPLVLEWRSTAAPVKSIRLVLETDRTPGWNEIDAVELLGSAGPQWATRARASSTFGSSVEAPRMGSQFAREPGSATAPR